MAFGNSGMLFLLYHCNTKRAYRNPIRQVQTKEGRNGQVTGYGLREDGNRSLLSQSVATKLMGYTINDTNNHKEYDNTIA